MQKRTWIELSNQAFTSNIQQLKTIIGSQELALVIKGNAYGHGIKEIALLAQHHPAVSWLCTAGIEEALYVRKLGITKPLLVLSYHDASLEEAIQKDIHLMVSYPEQVFALQHAATAVGKKAFIHVKIETGMARLGMQFEEIVVLMNMKKQLPLIAWHGIFTHLADALNPEASSSA